MWFPCKKRLISGILLFVLFISWFIPVGAAVSEVHYQTGAYYASGGQENCFPDKGAWSGREQLYIEPNSKTGDEYKPANIEAPFYVSWVMSFDGMEKQIAAGMKYRVNLEIFGQILDFDKADIAIDFLRPNPGGGRGYVLAHAFMEDVDLWNEISFDGFIPADAQGMKLRIASVQYKGDAAIYFRNVEVFLVDDMVPMVQGVNFGDRYAFNLQSDRHMKDYYGLGDKVYMDVKFNEPVFINDSGYLAYARSLTEAGRSELANRIEADYPYETDVVSHIRNNGGRTLAQQFGNLSLRFKYLNADGLEKAGTAAVVDRARLKKDVLGESVNWLKFEYTVRNGDEFKAEDITEMELVGGLITDNAYNTLPGDQRKILLGSKAENARLFRSFTQNFTVETSPPVLLSINGDVPEGDLSSGGVGVYLKYNEPVYFKKPDDKSEGGPGPQPCLLMNARYVDYNGEVVEGDSDAKAFYMEGEGTSQVRFLFMVRDHGLEKHSFDPLEILSAQFLDFGDNGEVINRGPVIITDAAGNVAPLLPEVSDLKLSDKKYYVGDTQPPEIEIICRDTDEGFSLKAEITDNASGVDYDTVYFIFAPADQNYGERQRMVPGREYSEKELFSLFGLENNPSGLYKISVSAYDRRGNVNFGEEIRVGFDNRGPQIKDYQDLGSGHFIFNITDDYDDAKGTGMASIHQKWVIPGTNPDLLEWTEVKIPFAAWWETEIVPPKAYFWKEADLYLRALDKAGNISEFYMPEAFRKPQDGNLRVSWMESVKGQWVLIKADYNTGGEKYSPPSGMWFCMTKSPQMPPVKDSAWQYKAGGSIDTRIDIGMEKAEHSGIYYLHIRAVDDRGEVVASETVSHAFRFDFTQPELRVDEKLLDTNQWRLHVYATDNVDVPEDITIQYTVDGSGYETPDGSGWKNIDNDGVILLDSLAAKNYRWVVIRATDKTKNTTEYTKTFYFDRVTADGKLPETYVYPGYGYWNRSYGSIYQDVAYTRDDFAELEVFTTADEFAYSTDGVNWSSWLVLDRKQLFTHMSSPRYYELVNQGYQVYAAFVPLPEVEGPVSLYTRYRKGGMVSEPIELTVVRDVTPPHASVQYSSTIFTTTAELTELKDNLCPDGAITVEGNLTQVFRSPGSHSFILWDAAGNKAEVRAIVNEVGLPPEPTPNITNPVVTITGTPEGSIVREIEAVIHATGSSSITLDYVFSTDNNTSAIPPEDWTGVENGATVTLSGVSDGEWSLFVRARDTYGNTTLAFNSYYLDATDPIISIHPNGSTAAVTTAAPEITVTDQYITAKTYLWSQSETVPDSGWLTVPVSGFATALSGVDGIWYLYVRAVDPAGNTGVFKSNPFNMVNAYETPHIVYSGEEEGDMLAYLVSPQTITVSDAVYCVLPYDSLADPAGPDETVTVTHDFHYTYGDGTEGTITAAWPYQYRDDGTRWMIDNFKGCVSITPDAAATTGPVTVTIEAPEREYGPCDIQFWEEDEGLYDYFFGTAADPENVVILSGAIFESDEVVALITEEEPMLYSAAVESLGESQGLRMYKVSLTTTENGYLKYHVDDGAFTLRIGHIAAENLAGNVSVASMGSMSLPNGLMTTLAANAGNWFPQGPYMAANTQRNTEIKASRAWVTYTGTDTTEGPVTATLEFSDNQSVIVNNEGLDSYEFSENGQFVFEYRDSNGNLGRVLAEVNTLLTGLPEVKIVFSKRLPTQQPVTITLVPAPGVSLVNGDIPLQKENGVYRFEVQNNGLWNFTFRDAGGNLFSLPVKVDHIDKTPPVLLVEYIPDYDAGTVKAVLRSDEPLSMPEGETMEYIFSQNGEYCFNAMDGAGNMGSVTATVSHFPLPPFPPSTIPVGVTYSTKQMTNKPVKITLVSEEPFTVLNTPGASSWEVTKNGTYLFLVKDALGRIKQVEVPIAHIDTEAPVIETGLPDTLFVKEGEAVNLKAYKAFDNTDGDITSRVQVTGIADTGQAGRCSVKFTVSDAAGNTTDKTVTIIVGDERLRVYLNGEEAGETPLMMEGSTLEVTAEGFRGEVRMKYALGYQTAAYFKHSGEIIDSGTLAVTKEGWITIRIEDQERNSRMVRVLINKTGGAVQ